MDLTFTLTGHNKLNDTLRKLNEYTGVASVSDLMAAASPIFTDAQHHCPVAGGGLLASGSLSLTQDTPTYKEAKIAYTAPYAWFVHEGHRIVMPVGSHHIPKDTGHRTKPNKWLEEAVLRGLSGMEQSIATSIKTHADLDDWNAMASQLTHTGGNFGAGFTEVSADRFMHNIAGTTVKVGQRQSIKTRRMSGHR